MALQVNQAVVTQNSETATRAYNSNVRLSKRALDDLKRVNPVPVTATEPGVTGFVPSTYTLLLSRIENSAAEGRADRGAAEQLLRFVANKLAAVSEKSKRQIAALPEFNAAGLSDFTSLPLQVRTRLSDNVGVEPLLKLLKHPVFASYMRDAQRASLYGPSGMLLAS